MGSVLFQVHLGLHQAPTRSTIAYANTHRPGSCIRRYSKIYSRAAKRRPPANLVGCTQAVYLSVHPHRFEEHRKDAAGVEVIERDLPRDRRLTFVVHSNPPNGVRRLLGRRDREEAGAGRK